MATTAADQTDDRRHALAAWIGAVVGASVTELRRRPGGGRHEAWDVTVAGDGAERRYFLRADAGPPAAHERYTIRREAEIYRAVAAAGVPVPQVVAVHPEHEAVLLEHVPGVARFATLDPEVQQALVDDFLPHLVRLHRADVEALDVPSLKPVRSIREHVLDEIDGWEARLAACGADEPFLWACARWLREHVPDVAGPPALVQGDTGPGNFLHDDGRVTAVLDFELAHLGDPMEDLAWIGTRHAQEPVPDFLGLLRRYEAAGGAAVDAARIRYHLLFAELRIAVLAVERHDVGPSALGDVGNQLVYGMLHTRLTAEALAAAVGTPLPVVEIDDAAHSPYTPYFDAVLSQLRDVVSPAVGDAFALQRTKSAARVVKFLREVDRFGDRPARAELAAMARLLGDAPVDVPTGRAALAVAERAGRLDAVDLLEWSWTRIAHDQARLAGSMGVLATRHLPVLPDDWSARDV
jgi:aminoglycoside phosphotransferase (APT) family kinase protein